MERIKNTTIRIYGNGIEIPGRVTFRNGKPPERRGGDIKGWSFDSRRRLRQFLMRREPVAGNRRFCACVSIPALPRGSANSCASIEEAKGYFRLFIKRCDRLHICMVWRLEVQPRSHTKREDIRGIPQPHWHIIGALPDSVTCDDFCQIWLSVLGDRGKVRGAEKHAVNFESMGESFAVMRLRYLFDHASKAKLEQVAVGWGRHWGVTQRRMWEHAASRSEDLDAQESVWALRFLRRLCSRRVPDPLSTGGIPWGNMEYDVSKNGTKLGFVGGWVFVKGWFGDGLPSIELQRKIVQDMGAAKANIWALKNSKCRRSAGQFFGVSDKLIAVARSVASQYRPKYPV